MDKIVQARLSQRRLFKCGCFEYFRLVDQDSVVAEDAFADGELTRHLVSILGITLQRHKRKVQRTLVLALTIVHDDEGECIYLNNVDPASEWHQCNDSTARYRD